MLSDKDLTKDQQAAVDRLYEHDNSLLMLPVGFGKTVVSLTAVSELLAASALKRVLVLAPLRVCVETWAKECEQWSHLAGLKVGVAAGVPVDVRRAIIEDERFEVVVMNFDVLPWFFETYGKKHGFDGLLIDELTKLKGGGRQFKKLRPRLGDFVWRAGMTGTLVEEGLEGLFYQVMAVDGGALFGRRRDVWLMKYFFPTDWQRRSWAPMPGAEARLAEAMKGLVFEASYGADEGLPDLVEEVVSVDLEAAERTAYDAMCADMVVDLDGGEVVEAANLAVRVGKLQQIVAGFLYDEGGEAVGLGASKMSALRRVVDAAVGPVVICYRFVEELERLRGCWPGGMELRDDGALGAWDRGELGVLFLHPASGGHGLNLQRSGCGLVVFSGPLWSRDQTDQVVGRVRRRGAAVGVVCAVTVVGRDTVEDLVVLGRLAGKAGVAGAFKGHIKSRLVRAA